MKAAHFTISGYRNLKRDLDFPSIPKFQTPKEVNDLAPSGLINYAGFRDVAHGGMHFTLFKMYSKVLLCNFVGREEGNRKRQFSECRVSQT